jgi:hypothetical protein
VSFDPTMLFLSLITGGIGFVLLVYGKKEARVPHIIAGLVFMVYPYFVDSVFALLTVGIVVGGALWLAVRQGY